MRAFGMFDGYFSTVYSFIGTFRDSSTGQDWVALPEQFVLNGYNVGGSGKL